jgi:hypothetical protein
MLPSGLQWKGYNGSNSHPKAGLSWPRYEYGPCMGPPRGRTLHVFAFGLFRVRPFKEGDGKRLEYIAQNGIMSMASHGLSH